MRLDVQIASSVAPRQSGQREGQSTIRMDKAGKIIDQETPEGVEDCLRRYFEVRPDLDKDYLASVGRLGAGLAFWTTAVQTMSGLWWLLSLPTGFRFYAHPVFMLAAVLGASLLLLLYEIRRFPGGPQRLAWLAAGGLFVTVLTMVAAREALRGLYVGRSGFSYCIASP